MKKSLIFVSIVSTLLFSGVLFYWFEYRPMQIRHGCSWIKKTIAEKPADPGITNDEVNQSKKNFEQCKQENKYNIAQKIEKDKSNKFGELSLEFAKKEGVSEEDFTARSFCDRPKEYQAPKPIEPAHDNWRQSEDFEYKFCLRDKGL